MTLTEAQVERWRDDLIGEMWGVHAHAELNALCDLALAQIRGQEPVAGSKDAERYQLLRAGINLPRYGHGIGNRLADAALDAELDKALKERTE